MIFILIAIVVYLLIRSMPQPPRQPVPKSLPLPEGFREGPTTLSQFLRRLRESNEDQAINLADIDPATVGEVLGREPTINDKEPEDVDEK